MPPDPPGAANVEPGNRLRIIELTPTRVWFRIYETAVPWSPVRTGYNPRTRSYVAYREGSAPLPVFQRRVRPLLKLVYQRMPRKPLGENGAPVVASFLFGLPLPKRCPRNRLWTPCTAKPDLTNLQKALEDCFQNEKYSIHILDNDSRIVSYGHPELPHAKVYSEEGFFEVLLEEVPLIKQPPKRRKT